MQKYWQKIHATTTLATAFDTNVGSAVTNHLINKHIVLINLSTLQVHFLNKCAVYRMVSLHSNFLLPPVPSLLVKSPPKKRGA